MSVWRWFTSSTQNHSKMPINNLPIFMPLVVVRMLIISTLLKFIIKLIKLTQNTKLAKKY